MSGDHNMHQKPEALELAAALEWPFSGHELKQQAAAELRRLQAENVDLRDANKRWIEILDPLNAAILKLYAAKGRYHTQLAACDLFDLVGLPNERPKNE